MSYFAVCVCTLFQADINATLELCHSGNEPSVERWQEDVHTARSGGKRHFCFSSIS